MEKNKISQPLTDKDINAIGSKELAYLGDSVYELEIRAYLIRSGIRSVKNLNITSAKYVSALAQAEIFKKIEPIINKNEFDIYKRGRNVKLKTGSKSTNKGSYRIATGLECIFGYLYFKKDFNRINELIRAIVSK